jgi:predicted nucleic acid-binding protein
MKRLSFWASTHVGITRMLIVVIRLLLIVLAFYIGIALYKMQIILPANTIYPIIFLILLLSIVIYPFPGKTSFSKKWSYIKQKTCDFILPLGSFLFITTMVNNADIVSSHSKAYGSAIIKNPTAQEILASGKTKESLTRIEKKILKKEFYKQLKIYAAAKLKGDKAKSGEAEKIIIAVIGAVGLLFLLASLVCSLSCNGMDGLAVAVGLLGLIGIIWGFIALTKRIRRGPKKPKESKDG